MNDFTCSCSWCGAEWKSDQPCNPREDGSGRLIWCGTCQRSDLIALAVASELESLVFPPTLAAHADKVNGAARLIRSLHGEADALRKLVCKFIAAANIHIPSRCIEEVEAVKEEAYDILEMIDGHGKPILIIHRTHAQPPVCCGHCTYDKASGELLLHCQECAVKNFVTAAYR